MSEKKYLWTHTEDYKSRIYIYFNEKNDIIRGTIVSNSKDNPYPEDSVYHKSAYIVGEAVEYLSSYTIDG
tara:strand:+ start:935 stop:1144 length:210 start_codon:yes stop_codon:yes gene_type:complete